MWWRGESYPNKLLDKNNHIPKQMVLFDYYDSNIDVSLRKLAEEFTKLDRQEAK